MWHTEPPGSASSRCCASASPDSCGSNQPDTHTAFSDARNISFVTSFTTAFRVTWLWSDLWVNEASFEPRTAMLGNSIWQVTKSFPHTNMHPEVEQNPWFKNIYGPRLLLRTRFQKHLSRMSWSPSCSQKFNEDTKTLPCCKSKPGF